MVSGCLPQVSSRPAWVRRARRALGRGPDHGQRVGRRAGQRCLPGQHGRGLFADLLVRLQQSVGQVAQAGKGEHRQRQHGELAVGLDRPLRQQVGRLRRGGLGLPGLLGGQCGLVDEPQEPEQLIIGPQRQAEAGQGGLLRVAGDGHRLAGGEHPKLGQPAAQSGTGAALQDRLHPAAVQPPGLRGGGQRTQRGIVDDHRPVEIPGQPLGDVLQMLLEHTRCHSRRPCG